MPISPSQAREHRAAKYKNEFEAVCEQIDKFLVQCHHWPVYWAFRNVPHWNEALQQRVVATYRKIGWDIELFNEQEHRDGPGLMFTERLDDHGHLSMGLD